MAAESGSPGGGPSPGGSGGEGDDAGRFRALVGLAKATVARFKELSGNNLAGAVTLAAFLSLFPLLLVGVAVLGFFAAGSADLPQRIIDDLGLTGQAADLVDEIVAGALDTRAAASVVGLGGLLWSGLRLVAAVEFALNTAWQAPARKGWVTRLVGLGWLVGAGAVFALSFALTGVLNFLPALLAPLGLLVALGVDVVLWLWTLKVLTNRALGWRAHLPGAVVGALGVGVLKAVGSIYIPRVVASASALYGSLGVVFAILAWLLFFGRLVTLAAVVNVVSWERDHGTVSVEVHLPRLPGDVPLEANRAGEEVPREPALGDGPA